MKKSVWIKGNKGRFWEPEEYKNLPYIKNPVFSEDGEKIFPNSFGWMYDNSNPMPKWIDLFKDFFDLKNPTFTFYRMRPGEIMPTHADHYSKYIERFGAKVENICRVIVMLEDWKPGHYFEIDGVGVVNWVAGDFFLWENGCPHAAANIGSEDRYTLQITGEKKTGFENWSSLQAFNVPGIALKESSKHVAVQNALKAVKEKDRPFFIYFYNQKIVDLDYINHEFEDVKTLNETGLDFYLYEPLCGYVEGRSPRAMSFYDEFRHKNFPTQPEILPDIKYDELDSISNYVKRNKLTNVTVYTGDYQIERFAQEHYPLIKLSTDDIFLRIKPNFPPLENQGNAANFTKKFISLNWRYTKHRHVIAAYLSQTSSNLSWYFKADIGIILFKDGWLDARAWSNDNPEQFRKFFMGIGYLNDKAPFKLDCEIDQPTLVKGPKNVTAAPAVQHFHHPLDPGSNIKKQEIEPFYNDSFCDIVTESRFAQPTGNYSEKTYQPMYYLKPFVLVAPPKTLKYLKEQGFKTFGDFWDESYDDIYNHHMRMIKIIEVIDFIESKSINELKEMYTAMKPILDHNKQLFLEKVGGL